MEFTRGSQRLCIRVSGPPLTKIFEDPGATTIKEWMWGYELLGVPEDSEKLHEPEWWPLDNASTIETQLIPILTEFECTELCSQMTALELAGKLQALGAPPLPQENPIIHEWLEHFVSKGPYFFNAAYAWVTSALGRVTIQDVDDLLQRSSKLGSIPKWKTAAYNSTLLQLEANPWAPVNPNCKVIEDAFSIKPRRIWDLCSNRVVPFEWILDWRKQPTDRDDDSPESQNPCQVVPATGFVAISHNWTNDMELHWTHVNTYQWPVPLPKGLALDQVRERHLKLGVRYCWLDVLCLRQAFDGCGLPELTPVDAVVQNTLKRALIDHGAEQLGTGGRGILAKISTKSKLKKEQDELALELEMGRWKEQWQREVNSGKANMWDEWKVDVPIIGNVYRCASFVIYHLNGLERPVDLSLIRIEGGLIKSENERHWLNRAWTLQEVKNKERMILGSPTREDDVETFMNAVGPALDNYMVKVRTSVTSDAGSAWKMMTPRQASHPMDRVCGLIYLLAPEIAFTLPVYDRSEGLDDAWWRFVATTAVETPGLPAAPYAQNLIYSFPFPSTRRWCPSISQLISDQPVPDASPDESDIDTSVMLDTTSHQFYRCLRVVKHKHSSITRVECPCESNGIDILQYYNINKPTESDSPLILTRTLCSQLPMNDGEYVIAVEQEARRVLICVEEPWGKECTLEAHREHWSGVRDFCQLPHVRKIAALEIVDVDVMSLEEFRVIPASDDDGFWLI
ncbi:hypothetical protein BDZ91DRAFT_828025 [Kalaharituber pfeilii]|nr:hypothetical protein BDZ91DRAFT_828025 [Kalaharituber pfeilii]